MKSSGQNVLVTGATGFVGGSLVEALLRRKHSVTCLIRPSSNTRMIQKPGVHLVVGELNDGSALRKAVSGIDTVFHIAGAIKALNRLQYLETNQFGTRNLLEAVADVNPKLNRFIHMSSLSAAGPSSSGHGLTEDEEPHPVSWYGESKLKSELEVLGFARLFPVTILRPSAVYGPRDMETLSVFRMVKRGWMLTPGVSSQKFSLIHVDDLGHACIRAGEIATPSGEIYYIARPEAYGWQDVGNAIASAMGKSYSRIPFPRWAAFAAGKAGDLWSRASGRPTTLNSQKMKELLQPSWLCDPSKARTDLQFSPAIDLENGIRETVQWYRSCGLL